MHQLPTVHQDSPTRKSPLQRVLGKYCSGRPGPTLVVTAGVHGNEPAGIEALSKVFSVLDRSKLPLRGTILGLAGNLGALEAGRRFISRDLNRGWLPSTIARLFTQADPLDSEALEAEDREQLELARLFRSMIAENRKPAFFLDLHSTSAPGAPFCAIADTLRNRRIAFSLPVPVILGLEENIDGTMLSYLDELGHVCLVFEGGQHAEPETVTHHEAAIWLTLQACGALSRRQIPDLAAQRNRLATATANIPHVVEIRYRHPVAPEDGFVMSTGYVNFQEIKRGETLAQDRRGEIHSRQDGRILMPLYQAQGDDGFFVVRTIHRIWLGFSYLLRRLRMHVLLPLLPGVSWHASQSDTLLVNPKVARYRVVEIFHLFGFRRMTPEGRCFVFTRRRPDFKKLKQ